MVTCAGLDVVEEQLVRCIENNIPGDFVETGVWRGGVCILAREIFKKYNQNRKVYVYDSFEGLPPPDPKFPADSGDAHWTLPELRVNIDTVKNNFSRFRELDDDVIFVKGWFCDTIPKNTIDKICMLRLDGDMYASTIDPLNYLYPKLVKGGTCIIDDYNLQYGAREACNEYRHAHKITEEITTVDPHGCISAYWIKE